MFMAFANALDAESPNPDCADILREPFAKLEGYGARLALPLQLCWAVRGEAHGGAVDERSVLGATALVHYF
jgi:hypothetical protein